MEPGGNTQVQLAAEAVRLAEAHAAESRSQLLPDLSASLGAQTADVSAMGLGSEQLPEGLQLPRVVGPYNTVDARATVLRAAIRPPGEEAHREHSSEDQCIACPVSLARQCERARTTKWKRKSTFTIELKLPSFLWQK